MKNMILRALLIFGLTSVSMSSIAAEFATKIEDGLGRGIKNIV